MKLAALAAAALLLAACSAEVQVETKPAPAPAPGGVPAAAAYPLKTCVVSDDPLGGMGDVVVYDHQGTEVRFCCASCIKEFKKDPAKYLAKIEAARKK